MKRLKKIYPYDLKTAFGLTGMGTMGIVASSFMSSYFMLYLTDYAGLGLVGASIAPIILAIGRIVDAVNDPLQGWIIDASPHMKFGKYRFFILLSIIISAVSISFLYSIPGIIKTSVVLLFVWVLFFYLLYDIGAGFGNGFPLIQTMNADDVRRSKFMLYQRILAVFVGAVFSALIIFVNAIDAHINNFGKSFSYATVIFMALSAIVSVPCLLMVKQGDAATNTKDAGKIHFFKDLLGIFKQNKAFVVHFFGVLIRNFVFTFMTATTIYYTKWAYSADLATGEVDNNFFGIISLASTMVSLVPMLISTIVSPYALKKIGSNVKLLNLANWITIAAGVLMFILQILGILQMHFILYVAAMSILTFGNGLCFVPTQTMWLECIDINEKLTGKPMGGTIGALSGFIGKLQAAASAILVGWILSFIGYEVDSATGNYLGNLDKIPSMLNWFVAVCALLPAICAIITIFIYKKYPLQAARRSGPSQPCENSQE